MKWTLPLTEAILIKRYKRFLADVSLNDETFTVHVPNTGSMTSCWAPEWRCALSKSDNPNRKMPHTLELTHNGETWIGVNTANANKLAQIWIKNGLIEGLSGYSVIQPEKKIGNSRIDFYLEGHHHLPSCYVEVKSVTLKHQGVAQFPDSVSERGQKHLLELMELKKQGHRAAMLYIVQREDVSEMRPAHSIDKRYGELLKEAYAAGVEIFVYQCRIDINEIGFGKLLPFNLE
ncbi:MAG: DNA/RNA nuclease SfsA [Bacteriovoracaceae bacterium]|nr:DNA/RNA nuclease SfsA [Bacteriovoracaceae bacterium]